MTQFVLLTGATGYVGARLLQALQSGGKKVRCLVRDPGRINVPLATTTEVFQGDAMKRADLVSAMKGVTHAYYLIHSMAESADFSARDRESALNFVSAAQSAGVKRIIYLGGLGTGAGLSPHLSSRHEVGQLLRESGVSTIEFRAAVVIGPGSLSFEMIRALVERLPVMITPRWVRVKTQPIAIEDLISYLLGALDVELADSAVFEIGGLDKVSYGDLMAEYARQRGLRRVMVPVPVLTPRLSSLWLDLVTPLYARVGRALIESLRHETVVRDERARSVFGVRPMGVPEAIRHALEKEDEEYASARWSSAVAGGPVLSGRRFTDSRFLHLERPPEAVFPLIESVGGTTGWYHANWLWQLRGAVDVVFGGAGLRRGRPDQSRLLVGDKLDFWRIEAIEPGKLLRLRAEMKLPGRAWLQFELDPQGSGASLLRTTAVFDPVGLVGLAYWYLLFPLHWYVFTGLLRGIRRKLEQG